jgi:hypothetical protein
MMVQEQGPAAGFSLYQNAIHNVSMQYPSIWNKQEMIIPIKQ